MLLYNGRQWVDIEALKAPVQVGVQYAILQYSYPSSPIIIYHPSLQHLTSVKEFRAVNDLQIGNHTLSALRFQATGIRKVKGVDSILFL
jgi:hypothetical protein